MSVKEFPIDLLRLIMLSCIKQVLPIFSYQMILL